MGLYITYYYCINRRWIKRVLLRDDTNREDIIKRVDNQVDESSIINKCDYIIDNHNLSDLKDKVSQIHKDLIR